MAVSRETIGLAGEYAVACELCKRGMYTQLTLGNKKRTDLLVEVGDTFWKVEVKSKQKATWPAVKGISNERSLLVFVDFQGKTDVERPDFYILTASDWKRLAAKRAKDVEGMSVDQDQIPRWGDGAWVGMAVSPSDISGYRECWEKISPMA